MEEKFPQELKIGTLIDGDDVSGWFAEAHRLFMEAEQRLLDGSVLPALSSLAAVPPLHRLLMERCSALLDPNELDTTALDADADPEANVPCGMYL